MRISCSWLYAINKYGYPPKIRDIFKAFSDIARLGFTYTDLEGVEEVNLQEVVENKHDLKRHVDGLSLKIINFCPILPDIVSLDKSLREKALQLFEKGVEIASFFGCETIQLDSFTPPIKFIGDSPYKDALIYGVVYQTSFDPDFIWSDLWDVLVDSIIRCNEKAKAAGLKLTMEPRVGEIVSNTDALLRLFDFINDDNFGALLETAHQHAQKEILPLSVEKLGSRINYVHVADNDGRTNEHLALGRGNIYWEGVFLALKKHNYNGYVAIDVGGVMDLDGQYLESLGYLKALATNLGISLF